MESRDPFPFWYVPWLDDIAHENSHTTPFALHQYATGQFSYRIPADVMAAAIRGWYGFDYDITTVYIPGYDDVPLAGYEAASHEFVILIDGIGWSGPVTPDKVVVEVLGPESGRANVLHE
ncbi:hypothetical protein LJB76_00175 [Clostridia bacterium OttesenSCG-928-O13]|nr:hypothetical protein [Clostridia bacterium OttesenSCG-928-O13]